jgi:hypothetical protein
MLIADYIAISGLVVSVERLVRGKRFISRNPPRDRATEKSGLTCVRSKRRSDDARSLSAWRRLPEYALDC